jgi:uncharacterized membrane protein YfhO
MTRTPEEPRDQLAGPKIRETAYRHREFSLRVSAPSRGWLVVGQLHDPGWVAYVDGRRQHVREIGEHLMGIPLAAGAHDVRFRYAPIEWIYGVRVTLLALLATATLAWGARRRGVW